MARVATGKKTAKPAKPLANDMYDDVDTFHNEKELTFADDTDLNADMDANDDEDDVAGVMDLDDEDDSDEDLEAGGKLAKIIAAERAVKRKLALQKGAVDDDDDAEEEEDDDDQQWGAKKALYYDAEDVDVDFDSDDEIAAEEEEEAKQLQRQQAEKMGRRADFGLPEAGTGDEDSEGDASEGDTHTLGATVRGTAGVRSEAIPKDVGSLSTAERQAAVLRDAPELLTLLRDLTVNMGEVRQRLGPLLAELQGGGLATGDGISYLEAKHMLLLTYCVNIVFYLLLKLEGRPVREHPVIQRLVTAKAYLEKIRPIDKRLQQQVDKLVRAAEAAAAGQAAAADGEDPMAFRPRPEALVSKVDEDAPANGAYRPPKLLATAMDGEGERDARAAQDARRHKASLRRGQANQFVRDLEAELAGAPEERRETGGAAGADSLGLLREKQRLEARARVEEDMMTRVPLSKEERKRLKAQRRAGMSGTGVLDDFADDAAGVIEADAGNAQYYDKVRLAQKFGADLSRDRPVPASGDSELPSKADLADRRAKYDAIKARQQAQLDAMADEAVARKRHREEDEFYTGTKVAASAKKQAKAERKRKPELLPPVAEPVSVEARSISSAIEKNRGLTPHRRKDIRNPRKHARVKFANAEKRRKGQVQSVRTQEGAYAGEATGIKSRVSKSTRFSS